MYAIHIQLDVEQKEHALKELAEFLKPLGFSQNGCLFFAGEQDAVKTVMAVRAMSKEFLWLRECVSNIRLLRIEANYDLKPAL